MTQNYKFEKYELIKLKIHKEQTTPFLFQFTGEILALNLPMLTSEYTVYFRVFSFADRYSIRGSFPQL